MSDQDEPLPGTLIVRRAVVGWLWGATPRHWNWKTADPHPGWAPTRALAVAAGRRYLRGRARSWARRNGWEVVR